MFEVFSAVHKYGIGLITMSSGILSISNAYNREFIKLLDYYGIKVGDEYPSWGTGNKSYSYYACEGFPDQINLYRFICIGRGGLNNGPTYLEIVDGTNTLYTPYKFHIPTPWKIPEFVEDDYEACVREVVEFYTKNHDHISILWSGGVDSSLVLAGFIKYGDVKKISVAYTEGSIVEFPAFYDYLRNNKFNLIQLEGTELSNLPGLIVHGGGPGAVGGDVTPVYSKLNLFNKPWQNVVQKEEWGDDYNSLYEFIENYLKLYGKANPTIADLCLFANTATKTNNGLMYLHYDRNLKSDKISTFFDNSIFKRWNYYHADKYVSKIHLPIEYKRPAKEIIFDVIKDESYLLGKGKVDSRDLWMKKCNTGTDSSAWKNIYHGYFFIDYSNERVSANSKEEYIEKYKGRFDSYFNKPLI